ncbi:MAG: patatin-like phospholipase family protein [Planctomycetota bacterium]|jgi:predicted acylesterase/phospholipase RssA
MPRCLHPVLLAMSLALTGCFGAPERNPVPSELFDIAGIPGLPGARAWADERPSYHTERFFALTDEQMRALFPKLYGKPHHYLAISGGGPNGAFGAGLLAGWTATGTRPEFAMVTGISTGALTAPFAFLGSEYDDELKSVYTTVDTDDILEQRSLLAGVFGDSMADTHPLRELLERTFHQDILDAIAVEYGKGRRLYIGTVNLDAGRPVIWNIGEIAASDLPDKAELVYDILQASAAIPVAFPPVVIDVEADGMAYDEMHVDGGTGSQVFVYPAALNWRQVTEKLAVQGKPQIWVIRNSFIGTAHKRIERSLMPIAERAIDSLIRTQGIGDLYQIHALCERDGNDFHLAYIPATFDAVATEAFDPVYMSKLFDVGYDLALAGYPWEDTPPGFGFDR